MSDSSNSNNRMSNQLDDSAVVELTGKIMVVAIIVLFVVVVFVFFLHLYAKWFWYRRAQDAAAAPTRRRRRHDQELSSVTALRHGLDPSVLKSIPVLKFDPIDFKEGLECAVCLSEVSEGEKTRLLPKCNHGFHVECIDMWFQSHSTCPICRNPVSNQSSTNFSSTDSSSVEARIEIPAPAEAEEVSVSSSTESQSFPTNVLFWGNETQVSTMGDNNQIQDPSTSVAPQLQLPSSSSSTSTTSNRRDGVLVIDIPRRINEEEDSKSPMPTPTPTRMRTLKRLLSRDRRVTPSSPINLDVEQVGRGGHS